MQNLHNHLPKDLVAIVEEYSKERTNYNNVILDLEKCIISSAHQQCLDSCDQHIPDSCNNPYPGLGGCWCEYCYSFSELMSKTNCYDSTMTTIDYILHDIQHYSYFLRDIIVTSNYDH